MARARRGVATLTTLLVALYAVPLPAQPEARPDESAEADPPPEDVQKPEQESPGDPAADERATVEPSAEDPPADDASVPKDPSRPQDEAAESEVDKPPSDEPLQAPPAGTGEAPGAADAAEAPATEQESGTGDKQVGVAPILSIPGSVPAAERTRPLGLDSLTSVDDRDAPVDEVLRGERVRYVLEGIEIRGNTRTRSRVVLRYLPFKAGDIIDVAAPAVELARYRLLGTGFFRSVQFSLRKGSTRGHVVLLIKVMERNTIVINDFWMGLSADADTQGNARPLTAYAGVDAAETNLAGTGITFGGAVGIAQDQLALRVRFFDPAFLGKQWMTSANLLFNDAKDFFGNAVVRYSDPQLTRRADHAVVRYKRFGGSLGVGHDLSVATQLWARYRLESVDATFPLQASHLRGLEREPIDFDVLRDRSVLSTVQSTLQVDTRDQPFLPTRGWFCTFSAELGLPPLGSDYSYQRFDAQARKWWALPFHEHVVSLSLFAGAIAGQAPFFEQFYIGDFSDLLPARVLGANFDRRPAPNFLNTSIVEVRYGEYAAKAAGEYRIPLYRGQRSVYGIDLFGSLGVYAVANREAFSRPPSGYDGAALVPVDLTANLGFRMDTRAGGFVFAFSNVLGFVPVRGEGPAGD